PQGFRLAQEARPVNPYWPLIKWGILAILLALCIRWVYGKGYDACDLKHLKAEQALMDAATKRATRADERLREALSRKPKTGQTVREVIREAPSDCSVNPAAVDRLRDG